MASVARNNLDILRISRKVILGDILKKFGGSEAQYDCIFEDGRYWCCARTIIRTTEADTSGKLEQAMGSLHPIKESAEEEAAIALIDVLKRIYRFEVDDVNFKTRARAEYRNEQLERDINGNLCTQNKQADMITKLSRGWNQALDVIDVVQETCEDVCGSALATPADHASSSLVDMVHSVYWLNDWTEQKAFEAMANLKNTLKD